MLNWCFIHLDRVNFFFQPRIVSGCLKAMYVRFFDGFVFVFHFDLFI